MTPQKRSKDEKDLLSKLRDSTIFKPNPSKKTGFLDRMKKMFLLMIRTGFSDGTHCPCTVPFLKGYYVEPVRTNPLH
jgi:hypothetical protein